jgi:type II secretory pathway pseudopilin PulG
MRSIIRFRQKGFSYGEALVSIAILGLIAVAATYSLRTGRMRDELNTAKRVLAGDLRSLQSRALSAQNLMWCADVLGQMVICEDSTAACVVPASCAAAAPAGVGMRLATDQTSYEFFGKYDPNTSDWRKSGAHEVFLTRDLLKSGAQNVKITALQGSAAFEQIDVAFQRQNGDMRINACPACSEQTALTITLTHQLSGKTATVSLNAYTGKISIE